MKQWIYDLPKEALVEQMRNLGLSTEGTLDQLRRTMRQFVIDHPQLFEAQELGASTSHENGPTPAQLIPPTVTANVPEGDGRAAINQIRKWGCQFDGKDPVSFLERIEELQLGYGVPDEQLMQGLPELLKGDALLWYRNHRSLWTKWEDFTYALREHYLPPRYRYQLQREIQGRQQRKDETFRQYATTVMTLMRRAGGFSRHDQVEQLYENMSPELKLYIRRHEIHSTTELGVRAAEIEDIERQRRTVHHERTRAAAALVEATAYDATECCWQCKQRGHTRRFCKRPPRKFCSQCGKDGVFTKNCHPRPENSARTGENWRAPRPQQ